MHKFVVQACVDDVLPVSEPLTLPSGEVVDSVFIPKGTTVTVSIRYMNQSTALWGPDAREFKPARWLTLPGDALRAKEIQGHRHLVTFLEGPRVCLGKQFALAEFKVCAALLSCLCSAIRTRSAYVLSVRRYCRC